MNAARSLTLSHSIPCIGGGLPTPRMETPHPPMQTLLPQMQNPSPWMQNPLPPDADSSPLWQTPCPFPMHTVTLFGAIIIDHQVTKNLKVDFWIYITLKCVKCSNCDLLDLTGYLIGKNSCDCSKSRMEFLLNGAELSLNSVNSANSRNLVNHWSMNWG